MNDPKLFDTKRLTNVRSTVFGDGMVVTADDLQTAMRYPVDLFETLVRAYFGCGVVCGLHVKLHPGPRGRPALTDDPQAAGYEQEQGQKQEPEKKSFCVKLCPGVALDCHGHPLELCDEVVIDLRPDPCACDDPPPEVYLALSRGTLPEAPRDDTNDACEECGTSRCDHRRLRECVRIKTFTPGDLPENLCRRNPVLGETYARSEDFDAWRHSVCACLAGRSDHCCGDAWVALACLRIDYDKCKVEIDEDVRRFVKPIECLCLREIADRTSGEGRAPEKYEA